MELLTEGFADRIPLTLHCFDRMVLTESPVAFGHSPVATGRLHSRNIRIFHSSMFANTLRKAIRAHAEATAAEHGLRVEFLRSTKVPKDTRLQENLASRVTAPGLAHIVSATEECVER